MAIRAHTIDDFEKGDLVQHFERGRGVVSHRFSGGIYVRYTGDTTIGIHYSPRWFKLHPDHLINLTSAAARGVDVSP